MGGSSDNNAEVPDSGEKDSLVENGKYVRYSNEQVEALERVYNECPKPSSVRRTQLIKECPILLNIEPKQIKVWFQNRRSVYLHSSYAFIFDPFFHSSTSGAAVTVDSVAHTSFVE